MEKQTVNAEGILENKLEAEVGRERLATELRTPAANGSYRGKFSFANFPALKETALATLLVLSGAGLQACSQKEPARQKQRVEQVRRYLPHSIEGKKTVETFWHSHLPEEEAKVMCAIAKHESGYNQFNPDGTVYRGKINPHDVGYMQLNEVVWRNTAEKLGFDIDTEEGNCNMALYILRHDRRGAQNWVAYDKAMAEVKPTGFSAM